MPGYEFFGEDERRAINEVFDLNGGIPIAHGFDGLRNGVYKVREFEKAFADRMSVNFAQAVSSGTAALKVGLVALGVGPGDEVITQSFTYVATVEAIVDCGATPIIVDIDNTFNMCPKSLTEAITNRTKCIIPVHMMGASCAMDEICAIAERHNLHVLEDTAQGVGCSLNGRSLGTFGSIGAYSFDAGKTMITGEGGMVVSNCENLFIRARGFQDHGHEYSKTMGRGVEKAIGPGFNFRMTEFQGAIGLTQLEKLDKIINMQRHNKHLIKNQISDLPLQFRTLVDSEGDGGDAIIFSLESGDLATLFVKKLNEQGIGTKNLPDAITWHFARYWSHIFDQLNIYQNPNSHWVKSHELLKRSVALPVLSKMDEEQISKVVDAVRNAARDIL